jgi:hypothetical protein
LLPGIAAQGAKLTADLTQLGGAAVAKVQVSADFPPNPASYTVAIGAALNPLEMAAVLHPLNFSSGSIDLSAMAAIKLALVTAQLTVAEGVQATLATGLEAGGISGWSYSGRATGFGSELERYTRAGFGKTAPHATVQAVIIATESFDSWGAFSQSVNTGGTAAAEASSSQARLAYLGELPAASWNSGVASVSAGINQLVADLRGEKSSLEAAIAFSAGLDLPDPQVMVDAGLSIVADVGIDGLLENMINVQADIDAAIGGVQADIDAVLALTGDITAQISAGGLAFWTYLGRADGLGVALRDELANGIFGGTGRAAPAYGLALAGAPSAMTLFGSIFKTS